MRGPVIISPSLHPIRSDEVSERFDAGRTTRRAKSAWLADAKKGTGFKTGRSHISIVNRSRNKTILEITIREGSRANGHIQSAFQTASGRGRPGWLEVISADDMRGRVVALPRREDIGQNINEQLIVELYSK